MRQSSEGPEPAPAPAAAPTTEAEQPTVARRFPWLLVSWALVAVPFLLVFFPPITDLPQQAAQIRLFGEALDDPDGLYRVQWTNPNTLPYAVLGVAWAVAGPLRAGWLATLILALGWVTALHALAWRRHRSPLAATLASILVFNGSLYWGFFGFVLGFPVFVAWFLLTQRPPSVRPVLRGAAYAGMALLLASSHLLWLAAGLLWLGVDSLWRWLRPADRDLPLSVSELTARALGVAPVAAWAAWWFSRLDETGFASPAIWVHPLWRRLTPEYLVDAVLGGLRGPLEVWLMVALLAWIAASALTRGGLRGADRTVTVLALLFLGLSLALPEKYSNTIQLNFRFVPPAMAMLLVALPPPKLRRGVLVAWAVGLLAVGTALTGFLWTRFEREEMSGLEAALAALPAEPRVIGLEMGPESRWIEDQPLLQVAAYSQVAHGGRINFSFAEFGTSLVVYREPFDPPWTVGLEWYPTQVKRGDFLHFDYALVSADPLVHRAVAEQGLLVPVTDFGRWRLYEVQVPVPTQPVPDQPGPPSASPADDP